MQFIGSGVNVMNKNSLSQHDLQNLFRFRWFIENQLKA